ADHFRPGLVLGDAARAAAVVAAAPVVEQRRRRAGVIVEVAGQLHLRRAAAQVLDGRVDEPDADLVLRARPAVGGDLELDRRVVVLVLDLARVPAGGQAADLFHVQLGALVPVLRLGHDLAAVGVDGHVVEDLRVELGAEAGLAERRGGVLGLVREDRVGVDAGVVAAQGVADFDVGGHAAAGAAADG